MKLQSIADEWAEFEKSGAILNHVTPVQREQLRMLFYAGFTACFRTIDRALRDGSMTGLRMAQWSNEIDAELMSFAFELVKRTTGDPA